MPEDERSESIEGKWYSYPPLRNAMISGILTGLTFGLLLSGLASLSLGVYIYTIAMIIGGYHWGREGIERLVEEHKIGIDILMLAAATGAVILGVWEEAAFLVFLFAAAEGIEEFAYAKTRSSIRALLDLAPKEARILRNGSEEMIPASGLKIGDIFLVRASESIPTDGVILRGTSSVNEAPVTGESNPVAKEPGTKVFAATINLDGFLEVRATASFLDNTLSKIIHMVEEAQERKGKVQMFIERFGDIYSPIVLLSAMLLVVMPPLFGDSSSIWAMKAVVLLVAAAPCALVMSTPVAIAAGIGRAGKKGVLIKGGVHLESLGKIRVVAFDKTGTLTRGEPAVTDVVPFEGDESRLLDLACSVERCSEHPIAKAIMKRASTSNATKSQGSNFCAVPGFGEKAKVGDCTAYVGKPELFGKAAIGPEIWERMKALQKEGKTTVLIGKEDSVYGIVALRDEIRPEAKAALARLRARGVKTIMLTGDNPATAAAVARDLGIQEFRANLKPGDKIEAIKTLKEKYGEILMVGDGINDAPALAQATVGVAMGTIGTDAAIEAADVALMADDLGMIPFALELGDKARRISRQNIIFSIALLSVMIPSALIGLITIAGAVILHETSELIAVANGIRVGNDSKNV